MNIIEVKYARDQEIISFGKIAYKNHKIFFEYDANFLTTGLQLSPFKLPLKAGVFACEDRVFNGLFGIFNDSLPDGWGQLLLDRSLLKIGIRSQELTPLERLSHVGQHGMGALIYIPDTSHKTFKNPFKELDQIAKECLQFQQHDENKFIDELLAMSGSLAGARPKIQDKNWIIKFPSIHDPKDIGAIEYAYHLMAIHAGLTVPNARLFPSKKSAGYFGVERFDREMNQPIHMHTVSGLLHVDYRIPNLDYATLLKTTFLLTKNIKECEKQFHHAVFNVFTHNRDDHAKNFSFLMDRNGHWFVSPAYDLTFSSGPAGEHYTTIMGEGKKPTTDHLLALAKTSQINEKKAVEIISQVKQSVSKWQKFAQKAGVTKKSSTFIQNALHQILKN